MIQNLEDDNLKSFHDTKPKGRDNIEVGGNAYQFKDKDGNDILLYSKINIIENMLDAYRDLALNSIERRIGRNEYIDFSKIDLYLHKAIYLHHNATDDVNIYIDEMDLPRHTLQYESASIIELFCFIISELKQELEQTVDVRISELSNKFKEQFLTHNQSLFNEETFEITILSLKEILDDIDKNTIYKDDDYWQLYEAIDVFLYGELDMKNTHKEGIFWGISNFWRIWEDMCHTYAFKNYNDIFYADTNIIIDDKRVANCAFGGHKIFCKEDNFENPFFIAFRGHKRWMRPDLIRITEYDPLDIVDFNIVEKYRSRINFSIKLRHSVNATKKIKEIYNKFLYFLKKSLKNGATFRDNMFYNYKESDLKNDKSNFVDKFFQQNQKRFIIFDWKYHDQISCTQYNEKIKGDIIKQVSYEFALSQNYPSYAIESQFVIPAFYESYYDDIGDFMNDNLLIKDLKDNHIKVFKANFVKLQQVYLSEL